MSNSRIIPEIRLCLIWLLSADTQLGYGGEGDETGIDYKFWFQNFQRQICDGLRDEAEWALGLMRYWDRVLFPNADDSLGQSASVNQQAVNADVEAMDAAFRAAAPRRAAPSPPRRVHLTSSKSGPLPLPLVVPLHALLRTFLHALPHLLVLGAAARTNVPVQLS
ncbi:hypothetical protein C8F04DRAFT_1279856 [Mycena alexandri]|uniref:Uncharacterized protein n=1 Tax=Mycena alexandri TaxID=1745969 RepID=A0AAD6RXI3_9AGAR|nr:hypothetical protein C8F04DRAFT_1279856 [Mycena alexandri]